MPKSVEDAGPKRLHLVTDPGFAMKAAGWVALYLAVVLGLAANEASRDLAVEAFEQIKLQALQTAHSLAWWSLLGLLSSSCCLIQILLNILSLGCSGINSWLGPLRPPLIAATLLAIGVTWYVALPLPFQWAPAAGTTLFSLLMTFTPEMYAAYSRRAARPAKMLSEFARSEIELELHKGGMGCISCVGKVRALVAAHAGVCAVDVSFEEGRVTARITAPPTDTQAHEALLEKLADANFPATLRAVRAVEQSALSSGRDRAVSGGWGGGGGGVWAQGVVGGLAGSSCCAVQLAINALTSLDIISGVGCTGINKLLGPVRAPVRAVSAALFAYAWARALRRSGGPRGSLVAATAVFLALTFLPEVLVLTGGPPLAPPTHDTRVLRLRVGGMGCEACQRHVQGVLDRAPGVIASSVDFRTGRAQVLVARNWGGDEAGGFDLASVDERLGKDGFSIALAQEGEKGGAEEEPIETCEEMAAKLYAEAEEEGAGVL